MGLDKLKAKLAGEAPPTKKKKKEEVEEKHEEKKETPPRRIRAKTQSAFAPAEEKKEPIKEELPPSPPPPPPEEEPQPEIVIEKEEPVFVEPKEETAAKPTEVEKLGPTGKHIKDLFPAKPKEEKKEKAKEPEPPKEQVSVVEEAESADKKGKVKDFKDIKPTRRLAMRSLETRGRPLGEGEEERWRKKRVSKQPKIKAEEQVVRPQSLHIRLPISVKDLAAEMKLKSSELISKLFLQGMVVTLNDLLVDETTVGLIGHEFGCEITIDTSEEQRVRITDLTVAEEIAQAPSEQLILRPPVVTFMGHVDHGKTSLIDKIRKSNVAAGEAGAITQHIAAFRCKTSVGDITIFDTPGHEAFSAMRARGAEVTDIVVLVVAGDEGIKEQTLEALEHAKAAQVTIVVAINKSDKAGFNAENVYRQLADLNFLPEKWGGQTITVNTSAVTGEGINDLLEMLALQAEVLELKANPHTRARGTVLESELHKGLGALTRVLVQNGTLRVGDAVVFDKLWGRVKTMRDEYGKDLKEALPSTPVEITGLSGLPSAGDPFIVVKSEKEAKEIAEARFIGQRQQLLKKKGASLESLLQKKEGAIEKKTLNLILRGDVQGSVEALKNSILKIESKKVSCEVIFSGVGEITESDVQLAAASKAVIIGFHTQIESHAQALIKDLDVIVRLHDIIYHAIDDVKKQMAALLDKIEEEHERGSAEVKALFKASGLGIIAGCLVTDGFIARNHRISVEREGQTIWKGWISSLKRVKEDVKEVKKGLECGILLEGFQDLKVGDLLHTYEVIYKTQEL